MMRERLAQLLRSKSCWNNDCPEGGCEKCDYIGINDETAEQIADYLLANGMVVPPCKLGQKVYRTKGNFGGVKIYEGVVDQIVLQDDGQERFYVYGHPLHFTADDIGKTVFLTKEDVERALSGENDY